MRKLRASIDSGIRNIARFEDGKFNAKIVEFEDGTKGVLKERLHSTDVFRGVVKEQFHLNECAFYEMSRLLRFEVVPETVWTTYSGQPASLQRYVYGKHAEEFIPGIFDRSDEDWKLKISELGSRVSPADVKRIIVLDLLMNNTDRHDRNFLVSDTGKVWAIDNGTSGAKFLKYYMNVLHMFLLMDRFSLTSDIEKYLLRMTPLRLKRRLGKFQTDYETVWKRLQFILTNKENLSFRKLSRGNYGKDDFPSYRRELMLREDRDFPFIIEQPEGRMNSKYY